VDRRRDPLGLLSLAILGLLLLAADPAGAGGSSFEFDRATYHPGDPAFAWSTLYLPDSTDDGPYGAWLAPVDAAMASPGIPPDAVYVGDITMHDGPYEPSNVISPRHARIAFTVPDLPPGEYTIVNCNWPCTAPITDITWGGTMVVAGPASPPPAPTTTTTTTTPPEATVATTTAPAPTMTVDDRDVEPLVADAGGSDGPGPLVALAVAGLGVVAAVRARALWGRRPSSSTGSVAVAGPSDP